LAAAIAVNLLVAGLEVLGGLYAGSLSLLSDALHNSCDAFSLVVSLIALRLARRSNTESRTFGYKRAEILAALLNSSMLVVVSVFLFKEALKRLAHPAPVDSRLMMAVAAIAFAVNCGSALLLRRESHGNLNIRASYLHLASDALASLAVVAGGACVLLFGWTWVDPLLTILIGIFVLAQGYEVADRAILILMQGAPRNIDLYAVQKRIESLPDIRNIHHVHMWQMTERQIHFEAHVNLSQDMPLSQTGALKTRIEAHLRDEFGILHSTLQFELGACGDVPLIKP
jgi:cobalt-zinc-cadmium efflux system protein